MVTLGDEERAAGYKPVVTLIHEATHKFAGTIDYCYFNVKDGKEPDTSMGDQAGGARKFGDAAPLFDNMQGDELASLNADSYAWFCYYAGRSRFIKNNSTIQQTFKMRASKAHGIGGIIG